MKYQLIISDGPNLGGFETHVNRAIAHGWIPQGGPVCADGNLVQAMTLDHTTRQNTHRIYSEVMDDKPRPHDDAIKAFYDADGDTAKARRMLP